MFKRMNIAVVLLSLLLLATGCGSSAPTDNNKTDSSTESRKEVEAELTETNKGNDEDNGNSGAENTSYRGYIDSRGIYVLESCSSDAKEIIVPDKIDGREVGVIGPSAFYGLKAKRISLPDSVIEIGEYAFLDCTLLEEIDLGEGLCSIDGQAFARCNNLKEVTFPESLVAINDMTFFFCDVLEKVTVPATTTEIPNGIAQKDTCPKVTIYTPAGSTAETVAIETGIPVENY